MIKRRGQAWGFDLMIAAIIFLAGIVIFYFYSINYPTEGRETLESLNYEGGFIAESLLSEGHPQDWTESNLVRIGISDNGKINETKLGRLYNLTLKENGYAQTRVIFKTSYDYYFNFSEPMMISGNPVDFVGQRNSDPENLIKVTRFTLYNNKPVTLNVYIWDD